MPEIPTRIQQPQAAPPVIELPRDFPRIPDELIERFPTVSDWQRKLDDFWRTTNQALQQAQTQTAKQVNSTVVYSVDRFLIYANGVPTPMFDLDSTGVRLGGVLVVNTPDRKVYIGAGLWGDADTPFYIDADGFFSLGDSLTWDPDTDTLEITGVINADSGTIGGFDIGPDYIRDSANSFGLASSVNPGNDVRFWAGSSFASRFSAPVRVYEDGAIVANKFSVGAAPLVDDAILLSVTGTATGVAFGGNPVVGAFIGPVLTAAANAQSLFGIRSYPNMAKGAFTGLTAYGFYSALVLSSGAGTIDNAYGLYIDTVNVGTNNWGLYVATALRNYMAGDLTLGSTLTPSQTAGIVGTNTNNNAQAGSGGE